MIKFENTEVVGWEHAIRGMRNPLNSWSKSDSKWVDPNEAFIHYEHRIGDMSGHAVLDDGYDSDAKPYFQIGKNDLDLMKRLRNAGTDHRKYLRMIVVYVDITAPLYWWKEFDTYKVGTVSNSCSTMHKIHAKEFTLDDFSVEHLSEDVINNPFKTIIDCLNFFRSLYLQHKDKDDWWQMIQLLPSSYNQKRTVMLNYEVLANIYKSRKAHKLDEWSVGFMDWIKTLPYSELITDEKNDLYTKLREEAEKEGIR